ncbi:ribonuclease D [Glutamicibacter sp. 287]|uniref:ribonuclease D n=1 Tax=Glutamicibacter sp. 287 TaxID=3457732 RepID=UPI004034DE8F
MLEIHSGDLTQNAFDQLAHQKILACDTETSGLNWQADKLGIVQLYSPFSGTHIVRAVEGKPAKLLCQLLEDSKTRKVFHHAPFDLAFLKAAWDVDVRNVACTKIASKLLWLSDETDHSLKTLLERRLGVNISKGVVRTSDWTVARLSDEQISYAAQDVRYLVPLLESLESGLADLDRLNLFQECCDFLSTRARIDQLIPGDIFAY